MNRRLYYLPALSLIMGLLFRQPLLVVSALLLFLILGTIDIWDHYCLTNLRYQRHLSEKQALFGEEITFSLTIENAKLLPLPWLEVEEAIPSGLPLTEYRQQSISSNNQVTLQGLFSPGIYERVTRRYTLHCYKRGIHSFGPTRLRSGDLFGFTNRELLLSDKNYLLVYPAVFPLTSFQLPARHPFGEQRTPRRLLEDTSRSVGVRDYVYGDSLRRVHWKATAREGKLQSKVYETTHTHTIALFLDMSVRLDIHFGVHPELQELAISAAASVTDWAINEGYGVGLYANTIMSIPDEELSLPSTDAENLSAALSLQLKRRRIRLPTASSQEQRQRILEVLARLQTYFGIPIEQILLAERHHLPAGATLVLITGTISELLIEILTKIRQSGCAVSILFVSDTPPPIKLAGIPVHHLGGEDTWNALTASYLASHAGTARTVEEVQGFHL